jgi:superfamily II DNA or RNA helicase
MAEPFLRQCCKMATGSGKTIVMVMAIAGEKVGRP